MLAVKGNREVRIEDHEKSAYLNDGFDIYSDDIELIDKANPGELKISVLEEENAKLKLENVELKKEISNLKGQITKLKKNKSDDDSEQ